MLARERAGILLQYGLRGCSQLMSVTRGLIPGHGPPSLSQHEDRRPSPCPSRLTSNSRDASLRPISTLRRPRLGHSVYIRLILYTRTCVYIYISYRTGRKSLLRHLPGGASWAMRPGLNYLARRPMVEVPATPRDADREEGLS